MFIWFDVIIGVYTKYVLEYAGLVLGPVLTSGTLERRFLLAFVFLVPPQRPLHFVPSQANGTLVST